MRRDQLLFLLAGIGLGAILGAVLGVVAVRPDLVGGEVSGAPVAAVQGGDQAGQAPPQISQVEQLKEALAKNPKDPEALASLGESLMEAGLTQQGLDHFRRALEHNPDDAVLHFRAARAFRVAGEREQALTLAMRGMELDQVRWEPAEAAFDHAFFGAGNLEAAERALDELERRKPDYSRLPELRAQLQEVRDALAAAAAPGAGFDTLVRAANYYYDVQEWAKAESAYRRALELDGNRPEVITDLGTTVGRQGRAEEAYGIFERALEVDAAYWRAAHNGVVIALRGNDAAAASRWLETLEALRPEHPSIQHFRHQVEALANAS